MILKARLPAEVGAQLLKALDAAAAEVSTPDVPAGTCVPNVEHREPADERPTRAARRADAFAVLAETFLDHGGAALNGGERHQIVVHVDAQTCGTERRVDARSKKALRWEPRRFAASDGTAFGSVAAGRTTPLADWTQLPRQHCAAGTHIDETTAVTRWRGEHMDYGIAVEALLVRSKHGSRGRGAACAGAASFLESAPPRKPKRLRGGNNSQGGGSGPTTAGPQHTSHPTLTASSR